jgi:dolichol-phosphate mannosyltransferase
LVLLPGVVGRVSDPMSGYFMVQRRAISGRKLNPLGYKILLEVLGRGRIDRIAEVGYVFQERGEGQSKVTWRQYRDYLRHLVRLRLSLKGGAQTVRRPWPKLRRLSRFGLVGLSGVGIDMACLHWLLESLGLPLNLAAVLAAEVAIANNFLWNDRWTFRDLAQAQTQRGQLARRFLKFNLICLCGVGLKVMLLGAMVANLGWNPYLANLVAIAIVTAWNFWINLKLNWRVTQLSR